MSNLNSPKETLLFSKVLQRRGISLKVAQLFELGILLGDRTIGFYSGPVPRKFYGKQGVIFPIKNLYKETVSVCIRYPKGCVPKYDTLPFEKSILFGLEHTYPFIYKHGAILVEGPFDAMALLSHGVLNVCALLGTSINFKQVCLLRRFTNTCYVVFDGDAMGRMKSREVASELRERGFEVRVVDLPDLDPDDFVKQYGKEEFTKKILFSV